MNSKTTKLWTARALRDHPDLRVVGKREQLIEKVREISGLKLSSESICRFARLIQNQMGLYAENDDRYRREEEYREYFSTYFLLFN